MCQHRRCTDTGVCRGEWVCHACLINRPHTRCCCHCSHPLRTKNITRNQRQEIARWILHYHESIIDVTSCLHLNLINRSDAIYLRVLIVPVFNAVNLLQQIAHTIHLKDERWCIIYGLLARGSTAQIKRIRIVFMKRYLCLMRHPII